ncbi:hypothetical protein JOB18_003851 [Solea senegalensis]|uniref:Uncharacterized protein n=1 Tax=Solea senegalensis TaxID=28829 RepID=A0AAV6SEF0_SOLSE|nr:hypothetical protein JOB18_003851 [Solea senegalensis]
MSGNENGSQVQKEKWTKMDLVNTQQKGVVPKKRHAPVSPTSRSRIMEDEPKPLQSPPTKSAKNEMPPPERRFLMMQDSSSCSQSPAHGAFSPLRDKTDFKDHAKTQNMVCQLPPQKEVLPVNHGPMPPPHLKSVADDTNNGSKSGLAYQGYIHPAASAQVQMSTMMPPTEEPIRQQLFKHKLLQLVNQLKKAQAQPRNSTEQPNQQLSNRGANAQARNVSQHPNQMTSITTAVHPSQLNSNIVAEALARNISVHPSHLNGSTMAEVLARNISLHSNQLNSRIATEALSRNISVHPSQLNSRIATEALARNISVHPSQLNGSTMAEALARNISVHPSQLNSIMAQALAQNYSVHPSQLNKSMVAQALARNISAHSSQLNSTDALARRNISVHPSQLNSSMVTQALARNISMHPSQLKRSIAADALARNISMHPSQLNGSIVAEALTRNISMHPSQLNGRIAAEALARNLSMHPSHLNNSIAAEAQGRNISMHPSQLNGSIAAEARGRNIPMHQSHLNKSIAAEAQGRNISMHPSHLNGSIAAEARGRNIPVHQSQLNSAEARERNVAVHPSHLNNSKAAEAQARNWIQSDPSRKNGKIQKLALCQLPPQWATLLVHHDAEPQSYTNSIAVYSNNGPNRSLIYAGYVFLPTTAQAHVFTLIPPTKRRFFQQNFRQQMEKFKGKEAEAQALLSVHPSQLSSNTAVDSAASSSPAQGVVTAEPSTAPSQEDTTATSGGTTQKFVLCHLPSQWKSLPVHRGPMPPLRSNGIAVYTNVQNCGLTYKGYICPTVPAPIPVSSLVAPTEKPMRDQIFEQFLQLMEKVKTKEAEAESQPRNISEHPSQLISNRESDSEASSSPVQVVVSSEPSATPSPDPVLFDMPEPLGEKQRRKSI